ncbi:radical SAM protein [Candidatus Aminicenantes bacterium AH-873-B07]|jgi:radical SAM protein with 4Fe4S-binding SPASM domain|nr:radical SAM protein [Candidatus Aminicenantes bacterium AH-873-B07]
MKKYFILNHNCFCEVGKNGAAIYATDEEKLFGLDLIIGNVIKECENGVSVEEAIANYPSDKKNDILNYLKEIANNNLGFFCDNFIIIERLKPNWTLDKVESYMQSFQIYTFWVELTRKCNFQCIHCIEKDGSISRCSCSSEKTNNSDDDLVSIMTWKKIIYDAKILGCKEIIFIGGEPFLKRKKLMTLINYAKTLKIENIKVKSNLYLLSDDLIKDLGAYNVILDSNFYSYEERIHDQITGIKGSWRKWVKSCEQALKNNLSLKIVIEVLKLNQGQVENTIKFLKELGIKNIKISLVKSNDQNIWPDQFLNMIYKTEEMLGGISKSQYFFNKEKNSCWFGKIAVTVRGQIIPCVMARNHVMGNVFKIRIKDIIRRKIVKKWWILTKDKIEKCKECEYRYACFDCRPIESNDSTLYGNNRFCKIYQNQEK